ncbi:MAG TPA: L-serine ammonia-lyase, iron-sulfur-dependent, subunit alpha [Candidatus Mediterraneibacter vanvlietii]|nr:L-serine ammonia-lyase, iron-sulfur-dependent, subunit alpha [Candidatus Mediterraneibacter vanvlietii]
MGCTEPIAIAYAAATVREYLGEMPESVRVEVSGNILKNAKSVVVPGTDGLRGIEAAAAAGIIAGKAEKKLEVISEISDDLRSEIRRFMDTAEIKVGIADTDKILDIRIQLQKGEHTAYVRISDYHTNITEIRRDGIPAAGQEPEAKAAETCASEACTSEGENSMSDREFMNVEDIVQFADSVEISRVKEILDRQIECNMAIANEGINNNYGANIGKTILKMYGSSDAKVRAKALAAAGSDARMNGCELPVVINSGSGNQGITASVPVIVIARDRKVTEEKLYRALLVSNLITIHLKSGIGRLSAYCGVVSAGCGSGAGIAYLSGGGVDVIRHTIVNGLATVSGIICDGAKASCAAKIASAVDAGLLGYEMYMNGQQFYGGDGIVKKGVENTIHSVSRLAKEGMQQTDKAILKIMTEM